MNLLVVHPVDPRGLLLRGHCGCGPRAAIPPPVGRRGLNVVPIYAQANATAYGPIAIPDENRLAGLSRQGSTGQREKAPDKRPVGDVSGEGDEGRLGAVVEHQKPRWLEQGNGRGRGQPGPHARVDERKQGTHECRGGEDAVRESKGGSEPPSAAPDRNEDGVIDERERQPDQEMKDVTERLGTDPVIREGGAEQEGQVRPREVELVP